MANRVNDLTKSKLKSAKSVSESYSTYFGCTPGAEVFNDISLNFVYPPNDNAIMLTDTNFAEFKFGSNYEKEYLNKENGSGEKYKKYRDTVQILSNSVSQDIFSRYFDLESERSPSNALNFYQEGIRTSLNALFLSYSDNSISIAPEFFVSYLELNSENKIIDSAKEEVLSFREPITSKEDIESILAVQGAGSDDAEGPNYFTKIFRFRFVPHEYIGAVCSETSSYIYSAPDYFKNFSYYNEDGLNPKYLTQYYKYITTGESSENEDFNAQIQDVTIGEATRRILNFLFPTESLENYEPGDTKNLGFFTIINDIAYFKFPIISQEEYGFEQGDFSFSEDKKILTFDFRTSGVFGNAVIPYIYDRNRMDLQSSGLIKLKNDDTIIFKSKKDSFDFFYPNLEILNGSFDKYTLVLSLMNNFSGTSGTVDFGDEEFKFPMIDLPHKSFEDFSNGKAQDAFVKDSESYLDSIKKFQKLPQNHYSFENGNKYSNIESLGAERSNSNLSLSFNNASYLKSQLGNYFIGKEVYVENKQSLTFVEIPFSKFASNAENVVISIDKENFISRINEKYRDRISVLAKAYIVDEFNQYFPVLRYANNTDSDSAYTNVYEFFLQDPVIDNVEIIMNDESFSITAEGSDLYYAREMVLYVGDDPHVLEISAEDVSGAGISVSVEQDISISRFLNGTDTFSGEVKIRIRVDQRNTYTSDEIISISNFYPNFYSNSIVKNISFGGEENTVEESSVISPEDLIPNIGAQR